MRNDAKRAAIVATFGHFEIGNRFASGAISGQCFIADERRVFADPIDAFSSFDPLKHFHDVLVIASAHNGFGFRQGLEQLLLKMLCQAAGDDQFLALLSESHQCAD